MKKRIVLCADDYGQSFTISKAIINLLEQHRLTATSCMVNTEYWPEHAFWLAPYHRKADIGLHFNLTEGKPLSAEYRDKHGENFQGLGKVLASSFMRSFSQKAIEAELHAQIDRFQEVLGILPAHIDGHQHIHQFPVIRRAVVNVYNQRLSESRAYIRLINSRFKASDYILHIKKVIVYATGTAAMSKLLLAHNLPHNPSFAGIYAFDLAKQYPVFFKQFLRVIGDGGLIMCHPGLAAHETKDLIAKARFEEYQYLAGEQFPQDCQSHDVELAPGGLFLSR